MNSGTTVLEVLKVVGNRNITVVTNNALAYTCCKHGGAQIICTGGTYFDLTKAYVGDFAGDDGLLQDRGCQPPFGTNAVNPQDTDIGVNFPHDIAGKIPHIGLRKKRSPTAGKRSKSPPRLVSIFLKARPSL